MNSEARVRIPFPGHVYIHVPFCSGKCSYCAFYSLPADAVAISRYQAALAVELELRIGGRPTPQVETLYCGGGTPSILGIADWRALATTLHRLLDLTVLREWTVEANPGTLPPAKMRVLREAGVTRISLGVQVLDDQALRLLGRRHTVSDVPRTADAVRSAGIRSLGIDLIAALPGVSESVWERTLRQVLALRPDHVSVYALSLERGTRLRRAVQAGEVEVPNEQAQIRALRCAEGMLVEAGLARYEISNFARPGRECLHNLTFWRGGDYIGFGPAAASRCGLRRWTNQPKLDAYATALQQGRLPPRGAERLEPDKDFAERFAFAFRLAEGVDPWKLAEQLGFPPVGMDERLAGLDELRRAGLLRRRGALWLATARGLDLADTIAAAIISRASTGCQSLLDCADDKIGRGGSGGEADTTKGAEPGRGHLLGSLNM